ncbi:RNA methyltransferase [Klugiella xanthotipulae]|uniref:tRNA G18 (Ribose-2'-O)-methylase SpoU n=1 Tax=Klugiella xanthotipulae TaxID=244735 RepID=A0A543HSW5_9MICO|nr:RNA methyltransferase [Klugiella xanthotipulae]TQM61379.1 tRNA G18 (ribose-2'-O)-methylase SpoU [Klugiella xanthotipulae]
MHLIPISDVNAPELAAYSRLTDVSLRRVQEPREGLYLAEGSKVIERALAAGHRPLSILSEERWLEPLAAPLNQHPNVPIYTGTAKQLEQLTGYHLHRGALAAIQRPTLPEPAILLATAQRVIVLEDIVDHTNVGAIFRSVAGLGADAVFITPRCADPLYRRSVRVSMGTVLQIPWTRLPEWHEARTLFQEHGFTVAALALTDSAVPLDVFAAEGHERVAFVVGTEGDGLSRRALQSADRVVTIPMQAGVDSLNVAAASAVALWELRPSELRGTGR